MQIPKLIPVQICRETLPYVEEQLFLRGFEKRDSLYVRRSESIVSVLYPCTEDGEDYHINTWPLWLYPEGAESLQNGMIGSFRLFIGTMCVGAGPNPMFPFRPMKAERIPALRLLAGGFCTEVWPKEQLQEAVNCALLAPLDYYATYKGRKERIEYMCQEKPRLQEILEWRMFLLHEKDLAGLQKNLEMEREWREKRSHLPGAAAQQKENTYEKDWRIFQSAESGDWGPAEQLLAQMSAGGLALLKRYHIEDKGPYPAAYARQRYDA